MTTLNVAKIIHRTSPRGDFFKVVWADNTETTVKLAEGDTSDEYTAFLYCLGKRMFKDKGKAREFIRAKKQVFEDEVERKSFENKMKRAGLNSIPNSECMVLPVEVVSSPATLHQVMASSGIFKRSKYSSQMH